MEKTKASLYKAKWDLAKANCNTDTSPKSIYALEKNVETIRDVEVKKFEEAIKWTKDKIKELF